MTMTFNHPIGAADLREPELPPVHPDCKIYSLCALDARVKALRKRFELEKANQLVNAVRAAVIGTQYQPS